MRSPLKAKSGGSQRWLQVAVNSCPSVIDSAIRNTGIRLDEPIVWKSPLDSDDFAEYMDAAFLARLEVRLDQRGLGDFWPNSGPRWDGLARSGDSVLLIEAKANISELNNSPPCRAQPSSYAKIRAALSETRDCLKVKSDTDWTRCFYQYANRLAHLYLLRKLNGCDAYLVFVYFVDDHTTQTTAGFPERLARCRRLGQGTPRIAAVGLDVPLRQRRLHRHSQLEPCRLASRRPAAEEREEATLVTPSGKVHRAGQSRRTAPASSGRFAGGGEPNGSSKLAPGWCRAASGARWAHSWGCLTGASW